MKAWALVNGSSVSDFIRTATKKYLKEVDSPKHTYSSLASTIAEKKGAASAKKAKARKGETK